MEEAPAAAPAPPAGPHNHHQQQQAPSPFLRCLSQLNDDVLATYLLPKLVEQGSAGALVLTCSQLRALCQPSIQHLDLSRRQLQDADNPCHSSKVARQLVAAFPQCTSLTFAWRSSSMATVYGTITALLSGLPNLTSIHIQLVDDIFDGTTSTVLDPVICQLRTHATALLCLSLQLSTGWGQDCNFTWASLGKLDTLTKLQLQFDVEVPEPCTQLSLRHLSGLSRLQSLRIDALGAEEVEYPDDEDAALQLAVQHFPGRLTALTELRLPLEVMHDISSVSACVNLRSLHLQSPMPDIFHLGRDCCVALAQLTCLTYLVADVQLYDVSEAEAFYGVMKQLPGLRVVGVDAWTASSALPVLQSLTQLTAVHGGWGYGAGEDLSGLVCPHIREMAEAYAQTPFAAFPNLKCFSYYWLTVDSMQALSRCCTGLQKLVLAGQSGYTGAGTEAERISACRSLAQLKCLAHLELAAKSDAELMAFTSAAAFGGLPKLQYLHVRGAVSLVALMQLLSLRGLQELSVHLTDSHESLSESDIRAWLVGMAVVPKVSLVVCSDEQQAVVTNAKQWAARLELPLPAVLQVSVGR